jgi:hypothetical protein
MILDVVKVQQVEQEEKPTVYKATLKGVDHNLVKMTLTIESDSKTDIQKYIPLMVGERRKVDFGLLNHTLGEYEENDMATHEEELRTEILKQEQRRRELLEA